MGATVATKGEVAGTDVEVAKPMAYMNRSGQLLPDLLAQAGADPKDDLLVLVDDVALPPGRFRVRGGGSSGGHNGLASVEQALGSRDYARLRIGVGSPEDEDVDLAAWVLAAPRPTDETAVLDEFSSMAEAVECWLAEGVDSAMNRFN